MKKWLKNKIEKYILRKFGYGLCIQCGKLTNELHKFADDAEQDEEGYWYPSSYYEEFCHESCWSHIIDSAM